MKQVIHKELMVFYSAEQMYALVNDTLAYPEFVEHCTNSRIIEQKQNQVIAELTFNYSGITKKFITKNRCELNKTIKIDLVNGPFKSLGGGWQFKDMSDGVSQIRFDLEFEVAHGWLNKLFEPVFVQTSQNLISCFTQRARKVYAD